VKVLVAQLGARRHYAVPRIFERAGMLYRFYTDIYAGSVPSSIAGHLHRGYLNAGLRSFLERRAPLPRGKVRAFQLFGLQYGWKLRRAISRSQATEVYLWGGNKFNELILRDGFGSAQCVYGFNSACEGLFREAKGRGLFTVMEQTIAPRLVQDRIVQEERALAPEWERSEAADRFSEAYAAREKREWDLAQLIICGSEFVREQIGLEGGPMHKCIVVPYGVELRDFGVAERISRPPGAPLQALFVGEVGRRKGVRYLLDAMSRLKGAPVRCRIAGGWSVAPDVLRRHTPCNTELVGAVPRAEVAREYARADIFCLPSLCEGSATVIYEALAAGLPVITTPNAGSIVRDGKEGFIVPVMDAEAIAEAIQKFLDDPSLLAEMSHQALERSKYGSLEAYGQRLVAALKEFEERKQR